MDWPERFSAALELELTEDEVEAILDLARDVAHATERRNAPLSAYLVGKFVGASAKPPDDALREAREIAGRLIGG